MTRTMQKHTITAFYETRRHADAAAERLRESGVPASDVSVSPEGAREELGMRASDVAPPRKTGFWASIEEMFGGTEDHGTYEEGVRRGHVMLTARVTDAQVDRSVSIVEEHGSIDLDEHEETWRREGWTGVSAGGGLAATGVAGVGAASLAMAEPVPVTEVVTTETVDARAPAMAPAPRAAKPVVPAMAGAVPGGDEVLQVVEERLEVGKRAVSRGKVRLHSYVVEREASEDVILHEETVTIDRHAVDRPAAALGTDAFRERTIEMEETVEEAVVGKTSHVVEEIGIRKDATDRTETIHKTVRSTKVDVEDGRVADGAPRTGAAEGHAARLTKDMEVVGSDGVHVGVIDRVDGDAIRLGRQDPASGGRHHTIMVSSVTSVEDKVMLGTTAKDAMARWTVTD